MKKLTLAEDPALPKEPLNPFLVNKPCPGKGIQCGRIRVYATKTASVLHSVN
jgi:hypothetical protein